jgi:hypothetical protein
MIKGGITEERPGHHEDREGNSNHQADKHDDEKADGKVRSISTVLGSVPIHVIQQPQGTVVYAK